MKSPTSLEDRIKARLRERKNSPEYYVGKFKVDFAESVARQLKETGISRVEIAEKLGTSRAYVTKMLNEVLLAGPNLTMESMVRLVFALGAQLKPPQLVPLSKDFVEQESWGASHWSALPSSNVILARLSRCPSNYDSVEVIEVEEQFNNESEKEVESEAVAIAS